MAEFGENKSAVGPPVAGWKAASGGAGTGTSPETHREAEPVSNGNCSVPDTVKRLQNESGCESPTWESTGSDSASKPIPRRSSLIKVGRQILRERRALLALRCETHDLKKMRANCCYIEGDQYLPSPELHSNITSTSRNVRMMPCSKMNSL